jgi:protein-tyrosine kinase
MNADSADDALIGLEELEEALIAHFGLVPDQVTRTLHLKRTRQLSFVDAAIHLGFITQDQAQSALEWASQLVTGGDPGLIETAMQRRKGAYHAIVRADVVRVRPSSHLILAHDPHNARSERLRALRTELMLLNVHGRHANTLALLSPSPGEGRSQLAAELAIAFSQLGQRTLLVDADLRRPRQHILFDADNEFGLAQMLNRGEPIEPFDVEGLPQLSLLTSGRPVPNPLELLSDGRFERMLTRWRYDYQFIIIDTPPVSDYADGLLIASLTARVLAVSRANITPHNGMREMLRRLTATHARILGAVMNHF